MSLHSDLLDQSVSLATRESRRPKQASLRRAVSAAYYALFHLLVFEASSLIVKDKRMLAILNRVYGHAEMLKVAKQISAGLLPRRFDSVKTAVAIPPELISVAKTFVDLQQARHSADYDLATAFTRNDAMAHIVRVQQAFDDWAEVRKDDCSRLFLASFLAWERWDKTGH
jgi:hypothetical protein